MGRPASLHETMNNFSELYKLALELPPKPEQLDRHFQEQATLCGLTAWKPGNAILENGVRLLVGVVLYSADELRVFDIAVARRLNSVRLEVFNAGECHNREDVDRYIPGLAPAYQTPFVGLWRDGRLVEKAWGFEGRKLIARVLDIDPATITTRPRAPTESIVGAREKLQRSSYDGV